MSRAILWLVFAPALVQAQQDAQRAAEQVVREALAAHDSMQWGQLVSLIHPRALAQMHQFQLSSIVTLERARREPRRRAPARDPALPACVAEWFEQQRRAAPQDDVDPLQLLLVGVTSAEEATRLSAEEFMARWLESHDERTMMRRQAALLRAGRPDRSRVPRVPPSSQLRDVRTVIGSVFENDSTVLVTYRAVLPEGAPPAEPSVVTVRRASNGWRLYIADMEFFPSRGGWTAFAPLSRPPDTRLIQEQARRVVTWRADAGQGRASLAGFADSTEPQELVLEMSGRQIRIPRSAFDALSDLLEIRHYAPRR